MEKKELNNPKFKSLRQKQINSEKKLKFELV